MQANKTTKVVFDAVLRRLMKERGVTQTALAETFSVSQTAVWKWLKNSIPSGDKLSEIANHFGLSVDELLYDRQSTASRTEPPDDRRVSDYITGLSRSASPSEVEQYFAIRLGPIIQQTYFPVTDVDIERGYVVTPPLEFLTDEASTELPDTVRLNKLSNKVAARITSEAIESCDPSALLETALEDRLEGREPHEIIRLLTPFAIFHCVRAVLILTFGPRRANELLSALGYDWWIKFANDGKPSRQRKKSSQN